MIMYWVKLTFAPSVMMERMISARNAVDLMFEIVRYINELPKEYKIEHETLISMEVKIVQ